MPRVIDQFVLDFDYLSNFYPSPLEFDGIMYDTVEHAFQAHKSKRTAVRMAIAAAKTPGCAKSMGRSVKLRDDWEDVKEQIMLSLLRLKFKQGSELANKLLSTHPKTLIEGNAWGDRYWGVDGWGENMLGILLMQVRDELRT